MLGKKRRADEQEKLMTGEMRGFGATAHAALDEKEKVKGKERRMRHEWYAPPYPYPYPYPKPYPKPDAA